MKNLFKKIAATVVTAAMLSATFVVPAIAEETAATDADKTWRVICYEGKDKNVKNYVGGGIGTQKLITNEGGIGTKSSSDTSMKLQQTSEDVKNADGVTYNTGNFKLHFYYEYPSSTSGAEYLADKNKKYGVIGCDFYLDDDNINRFRVDREGGRNATDYYSLNKVSKQVWHSIYAVIDFSDIKNKNFRYTYYLDGKEVANGVYPNQYNTEFPTQLRLVFDNNSITNEKCAAGFSLTMHMDNVEYYVTDVNPLINLFNYETDFSDFSQGKFNFQNFSEAVTGAKYVKGVGGREESDVSVRLKATGLGQSGATENSAHQIIVNQNDINPQAAYTMMEFAFLPSENFTEMHAQSGWTENVADTSITKDMLKEGWNRVSYVWHDFDGKRTDTTAAKNKKNTAFYIYLNGKLVHSTSGTQCLLSGKTENPYDIRAKINPLSDSDVYYFDDFKLVQSALPPVVSGPVFPEPTPTPEPTATPEPVSVNDGSFESAAVGTVFSSTNELGKFYVTSAANAVTDEAAATGSHSLKITPPATNTSAGYPGVNYKLALHEGVTYKATAKIKLGKEVEGAVYTGGSTYIRFTDLGSYTTAAYNACGKIEYTDFVKADGFVTLETIFTMPESFSDARLNITGINGHEWYIDDITCEETTAPTPTPEPTATPVPTATPEPTATPAPTPVPPINFAEDFSDGSLTAPLNLADSIGSASYTTGIAGKDSDDKSLLVTKVKHKDGQTEEMVYQTDTYIEFQAIPTDAKYATVELNFMPNGTPGVDDFDSFKIGARYSNSLVKNIGVNTLNESRWNNLKFVITHKESSTTVVGTEFPCTVKVYVNGNLFDNYEAKAVLSADGKYQLRFISVSKKADDLVNSYFDDIRIKTYNDGDEPVMVTAPELSIDPEKGVVDNDTNTITIYGSASKSDIGAGKGKSVKVYTDGTFATEVSTISAGNVVVIQDADKNIYYYDVKAGEMTINNLEFAYSADNTDYAPASKTDIKNGYYKYTATALNGTTEGKDITPIIALYDATGKLVDIDFKTATAGVGQTASATASINVSGAEAGMYIKTFIWDTIGGAKPYETEPVKILIIGNSITQHGSSPEKGWLGTWGMAASAESKDYVHQLMSKIDASGREYELKYRNISEFEKYFYDWSKFAIKSYDDLVDFDADIIIATFGANCKNPNNEGDPGFSTDNDFTVADYENIISHFNADGNAKIIVGKTPLTGKDILNTTDAAAAKHADWTVVDMTAYTGSEYDASSYYQTYTDVFNGEKAPNKVVDPGVIGHPGDKAMAAMAEDLWKVLPDLMDSVR